MVKGQFETICGEEVMSVSQIARYLNKSRGYIYSIAKNDDTFPPGFSLHPKGKKYWKREEVDSWIRSKMG